MHPQNFKNRNKSCHRFYRSVANFPFVVAFAYIGKINSLYVLRIGCEKKTCTLPSITFRFYYSSNLFMSSLNICTLHIFELLIISQ